MYAVLDTAPPSALKLPVDWPVTQSKSAIPESPACFRWKVIILDFDHNAVLPSVPPYETGWLLDSSQIVASIQSFRPRAFPIENGTAGVAMATIFAAARQTDTVRDGVNNVAIVQVAARFVVTVVDVHPRKRPVEPKPPSER
jgi:hypothetical protein